MVKDKTKKNITNEIDIPNGVTVSVDNHMLTVKGPKGEVKKEMRQHIISFRVNQQKLMFESKRNTKEDKKIMGSLMAHFKNMIRGSTENHNYVLKICAGHFPMNVSVSGNKLIVKNFLGEKVPRTLELKQGADVKVEGDLVNVTSASKEIASQVSADIEQLTRRPGFDTRIFQDGIYIINKDGKELK
jgi:large subunit ribosomal protein L6